MIIIMFVGIQVWRVFGRLFHSDGRAAEEKKVFCKLCVEKEKEICGYGDSTGTDTLLNHIARHHSG